MASAIQAWKMGQGEGRKMEIQKEQNKDNFKQLQQSIEIQKNKICSQIRTSDLIFKLNWEIKNNFFFVICFLFKLHFL